MTHTHKTDTHTGAMKKIADLKAENAKLLKEATFYKQAYDEIYPKFEACCNKVTELKGNVRELPLTGNNYPKQALRPAGSIPK